MDCWGHSLAKVIINKHRGDGTTHEPTHDWRHKLRVIISSTFAEFETRDAGTASWISQNEFDHFNVREIKHRGLKKKDFVIRDG